MSVPSVAIRSAACLLSLFLVQASAEEAAEPFSYPTGLLDAPATLTEPAGAYARLGKPVVNLHTSRLSEVADLTDAVRLREGHGSFRRDTLCLAGTENGRPLMLWLIATDSDRVTEAQLQWAPEGRLPEFCRRLPDDKLPIRLGQIGLGMTKTDIDELVGPASHEDAAGWRYWFCQRFLRNDRDLQELELNWLAVRFDLAGRAVQAFISTVVNL